MKKLLRKLLGIDKLEMNQELIWTSVEKLEQTNTEINDAYVRYDKLQQIFDSYDLIDSYQVENLIEETFRDADIVSERDVDDKLNDFVDEDEFERARDSIEDHIDTLVERLDKLEYLETKVERLESALEELTNICHNVNIEKVKEVLKGEINE